MTAETYFEPFHLNPFERQIVLLLFLCMQSDPGSLRSLLIALKDNVDGLPRPLREADIESALARLMTCGLVRRHGEDAFGCAALPLDVQRGLFLQPQTRPMLAAIEHTLNNSFHARTQAALPFIHRSRLKPLCLIHQALLEDRLDDVRFFLLSAPAMTGLALWPNYSEAGLVSIIREADGVAPRILRYLFPDLAATALATGEKTEALQRALAKPSFSASTDLQQPRLFLALCAWHTWTANREGLASLATTAPDPAWRSAPEACRHLLDGDAAGADQLFTKALRNRLGGYGVDAVNHGPFHLIATLAAIRANKSASRVRARLRAFDAQLLFPRRAGTKTVSLDDLQRVANEGGGASARRPEPSAEPEGVLDTFVVAMESLFVPDDRLGRQLGKRSARLLRQSHEAGYGWMAASLVPCVRRLLPDDEEALDLCRRVADAGVARPLWETSHIVDPWEQAIQEIANLLPQAPSAGGTAAEPAHVLEWLLVLDARQPDDVRVTRVTARLRKRLKNGQWSSGRHLYFDNLQGGAYDDKLDEQDRKVIAAFNQHPDNYTYRYYGSERDFCLVPALADHPRVFKLQSDDWRHPGSGDTLPIRIVRGEPAIEIGAGKKGGESVVRVPWRHPSAYENLQIVQERDDVYTVYEKGSLHKRLSEIVDRYGRNQRLVIPAEGAEALKRLLAPLAQVIGIKGEFDTESVDARHVEGGVHLHLRARFVSSLLHLDLVNQPVPELPLYLAPGGGMRKTLSRLAGETVAVCRDIESERKALAAFTAACPALAAWAVTENHWEIESLQEILTVLDEVHTLADPVPLEWPEGEPIEVVRPGSGTPYALNSAAGADYWLEIGGDVTLDDGKVMAFTDLLAGISGRTERFVPLGERRYLCLTRNLARQLELLAQAGEVSKKRLRLPPASIPLLDTLAPADGRGGFDFPTLVRDRIADFRKAFRQRPSLPASLTCELRPYQKEGFVWLSRLAACGFGACLADDMGLGKTIQVLALLSARAGDGPALVIAPTSVSRNWADEAARFAPALRVALLAETPDRAACVAAAASFDVIVCSYGLLTFEEELLTSRAWNAVVLDEAQAVKNRLAKRTRIVKRLDGRIRIVSTGTPVENNLGELWSLFDFLNPGLLGSHGRFEHRYGNSDGSVSPLLKRMTAPFILRRLKSEVLDDLPPKTEISLTVTLDDEERSLYESCRREALAALDTRDDDTNRITILAHLTRLRRACCHPSLLLPGSALPGQKVETFLELVDDLRASGHRALVFSQFVDFLGIIRQRLDQAGVTYQYLDGATPLRQRTEAVSRFQRGEGDLFLISLKAGGTGLNLTAANFVILLDPWWNPAVEMQAADRAHRIGQRNPVTIYRLVTADTVEERVVELHARKRAMAEELLDGTGSTRLSAADLVALFRT